MKVPLVVKGKSRLASAKRVVPSLPKRFVIGKLIECLSLAMITVQPKLMRRGAVFRRLSRIAKRHRLPYLETDNIMSSEALAFIESQHPDVIVTLVHQILKAPLIALPKHAIINIHPGILPEFRGIQPYFWQLAKSFEQSGPTLHLIEDENIDTGKVLAQASYKTLPGMSVQLNYYLTAKCAAQLLPQCVAKLGAGQRPNERQPAGTPCYYRWPDSTDFNQLLAAGHTLLSLRDLWGILSGHYDEFTPTRVEYYS